MQNSFFFSESSYKKEDVENAARCACVCCCVGSSLEPSHETGLDLIHECTHSHAFLCMYVYIFTHTRSRRDTRTHAHEREQTQKRALGGRTHKATSERIMSIEKSAKNCSRCSVNEVWASREL
jgi:hypothetical protein